MSLAIRLCLSVSVCLIEGEREKEVESLGLGPNFTPKSNSNYDGDDD